MAIDPLNWYKASIQATDGTPKEVYLPSRPTAEGAQPTDTTLSVPRVPADAAAVGTELGRLREDLGGCKFSVINGILTVTYDDGSDA